MDLQSEAAADSIAVPAAVMATSPRGYLPTLDGWRAIAIVGVLIDHGVTTLFGSAGYLPNVRLLSYAFRGALGVPIFFAISG